MGSWIGKEVLEDESNGGYRDAATGKPLSKKLAAWYMAFCKRHSRRCHTGDMVDKYLRLVDKYQPRVFAEARIHVARFPEQVGDLLKQIKKVRKQIRKARGRRKQQRPETPSNSGEAAAPEAAQCAPPGGGAYREDAHGGEPTPTPKTEHAKRKATQTQQVRKKTVNTDTPPEPSYGWPWGDSGRPSDRGDSPSHLALRPSEPSGRPSPQAHQPDSHTTESGRILLVPNVQWRGVQLIQEHMAKARADFRS